MADPHWTSYVGMATGIAGLIMGIISYRKSNSLKSLALRLELRKALNDLQIRLSQLNDLLEHANQSRQDVLRLTGNVSSGSMVKWKADFEKDKNNFLQLTKTAPNSDASFDDLTPKELESKLVGVHKLQGEVNGLREKYQSFVNSDDEERKQIREDNRTQPATL